MNLKTFRPSYILKRLALSEFQRKLPNAPWLAENAVYILNSWLEATDKGFEWGSGRITIWFAEKSEGVISVEHHKGWYDKILSQVKAQGLSDKVQYFQIDLCEEYESKIDDFDQLFDYILVDGRRRLNCFKKAIPKVTPGGMLILDNSDRYIPNYVDGKYLSTVNRRTDYKDKNWEETVKSISEWRQLQTSDGINDTTFWIKPHK